MLDSSRSIHYIGLGCNDSLKSRYLEGELCLSAAHAVHSKHLKSWSVPFFLMYYFCFPCTVEFMIQWLNQTLDCAKTQLCGITPTSRPKICISCYCASTRQHHQHNGKGTTGLQHNGGKISNRSIVQITAYITSTGFPKHHSSPSSDPQSLTIIQIKPIQ